jgi:hypothetical protein
MGEVEVEVGPMTWRLSLMAWARLVLGPTLVPPRAGAMGARPSQRLLPLP